MSGLEIAGVALAVPGVIDLIIRGGVAVWDRIETFRTVDEAVNRFRQVALDITEGPLYYGLDALRSASRDRTIPASIKDQLEKSLKGLQIELDLTREGLNHVHEDTFRGKLVYTFWVGKGSRHELKKISLSLQASSNTLKDLCLQLRSSQTAQSSYFWPSDVFKVTHETQDNKPGQELPDSEIFVASGNYSMSNERIEADFILEKKLRENDVRYLCSVLNGQSLKGRGGILPVLGYRQPPYNEPNGTKIFQLIIELPKNVVRQSLAHRIACDPCPDLLVRLGLCLEMASALCTVHSLELVHKSLRPRSMLILSQPVAQRQTERIYLQDWAYIRELSGATTQLGEDSWQKALYQHPERQGKYAESAYQYKHDIYSLGVCMLEVLLWTPFVVQNQTSQSDEPYRVCDLFDNTGLSLGEANGGIPERYRGRPSKLTSRPLAIKTIWCEVAHRSLDEVDLGDLVIRCLDSGLQDIAKVIEDLEKIIEARV